MEYVPNKNFSQELKEKVSAKLERAKNNPILDTHLVELENEIASLGTNSNDGRIDEIQAEILASSAVAEDLIEFKEILTQLAEMYGQSEEWVFDLLAHENAHANVAEQMDYGWVGYVVLFVKDDKGRIISTQPAHFLKARKSWDTIEHNLKDIAVTDAPRTYGNKPSIHDEREIERIRNKLEILAKVYPERMEATKNRFGL